MNELRWIIPPEDPVIPEALLRAGCTPLLAAMLHIRGYGGTAEALAFLDSGRETLRDPLELKDMDAAAARLRQAIRNGEHVAVYGDYDVDGITSSCMTADYLRRRGVRCELYIPDRMEEGYGVNAAALRELREMGVELVVTVDCGVTTVEETAYARELGMDMVITDHHECRDVLPPACAVVDPKRPDCGYTGGELAGVGVAFKLLCALEGDAEAVLNRYADLVAVGTIADVMPLMGENRYIVKRGLEKLESSPCPGLLALIREAGLGEKKLSAASVGFTLAPRLNASGRLGQVQSAVSLLLTDQAAEAARRAGELCQLNRDRQALELEIWQQAREMLGASPPSGPIVLAREGWHQGVVGIAASRLTETFHVPAVMICLDGDKGKGSCRSCGGFNLFEALSACGEHLEGFGGHALAAGLTIRREKIDAFRAALEAYYRLHPASAVAELELELRINAPELLRMECVEDLERLEPCGTGNPRALMYLPGARLTELTPIGGGRHLRLRMERFGQSYEAVWFAHTLEDAGVRPGDWADAAFSPQINLFRNHKSVQLLLSGLRAHDDSAGRRVLLYGTPPPSLPPPAREDFALVWRALAARGGAMRDRIAGLTDALAPRMREERLCGILRVFQEVGLVSVAPTGNGGFDLRAIPCAGKADLNASPLLWAWKTEAGA